MLGLLELVVIDELKVEKKNQYGQEDVEPVLPTSPCNHRSQLRQDLSPDVSHSSHPQGVNLSV